MELTVRDATLDDIPVIRYLAMSIWPHTYDPIIGPAQVAYMLELFYSPRALARQIHDGHMFLLAYHAAEPVAFASYSEIEPKIFKLHKLYILPSRQRRGIGERLIGHIVQDVRNRHARTLHLNINRHNLSALSFYKKHGFGHLKDEDIDIGSGFFMNDHVLHLPL